MVAVMTPAGDGEEYIPVDSFFQAYVDALSDPPMEQPKVVPGERCHQQNLLRLRTLRYLPVCVLP